MNKKIISLFVIISLLVGLIVVTYATPDIDDEDILMIYEIIGIIADVEQDSTFAFATITNGRVLVRGNIVGNSNSWVNIIVRDGSRIDFVADTRTDSSGNFSFEYVSEAEGDLLNLEIWIRGAEMYAPIPVPIILNVSTIRNRITINGVVPNGENQWVTVLVRDSNGNIDYIADTVADSYGRFEFAYTTERWAESLTVRVNAAGFSDESSADAGVEVEEPTMISRVGEEHIILVTADNVRNGNREITISYDPNILEFIDLWGFSKESIDVEIIRINPTEGSVTLRFNFYISYNMAFSGSSAMLKFVGVSNGPTVVEIN